MNFARFLVRRGFYLGDDEDDYEPDKVWHYKGFAFGTAMPNGGAITVEIYSPKDGLWYARIMEDCKGWDFSSAAVKKKAHTVLDRWIRVSKNAPCAVVREHDHKEDSPAGSNRAEVDDSVTLATPSGDDGSTQQQQQQTQQQPTVMP
jgi:hypothetical protein